MTPYQRAARRHNRRALRYGKAPTAANARLLVESWRLVRRLERVG